MDKAGSTKGYKLGDRSTSDIILILRNSEGRSEQFYSHSFLLSSKSKFFADKLDITNPNESIDINVSVLNYDHYVSLIKLLYIASDLQFDHLDSVKSALGILQLAISLSCEEIANNCIQFLEASPWEEKEEEEIVKVVSKLGPIGMPILARIQPVDSNATKNVFISAVRFATSIGGQCPPFGDEIKTSAQEQIEYMLGEDKDMPIITTDDEVKSVVKTGMSNIFSLFEAELTNGISEDRLMHCLSDLEWMCNIIPKMDLMKEFVSNWLEISTTILRIIEDDKLDSLMWGLKFKVIEITGKALEAVGYGNVILASPCRVRLLKTWLPYIRKIKPILDAKSEKEISFGYKMDEDLCQSIEGAIVSLVLALPSNDQADILTEWMKSERGKYPDLSEAFEVWCYRTKSAKRRLMEGLDRVGNSSVSL
ncbi:hypothetical protein ACFE04_005495 [Oxalis oulophora]